MTAAALASEHKSLADRASVGSLLTSANQEDPVSMATLAARRLQLILHTRAHIVATELRAAAQGIEVERTLNGSPSLENLLRLARSVRRREWWTAGWPTTEAVHYLAAAGAMATRPRPGSPSCGR